YTTVSFAKKNHALGPLVEDFTEQVVLDMNIKTEMNAVAEDLNKKLEDLLEKRCLLLEKKSKAWWWP
ncbi:hypothetical protein A2U01_0084551, partial [Trifolium medium]|nr:hypothetical protein [Trifolium medium]